MPFCRLFFSLSSFFLSLELYLITSISAIQVSVVGPPGARLLLLLLLRVREAFCPRRRPHSEPIEL